MSDEIKLDTLWTQIESEPVDKQVRIDAASRSGQSGDLKYVPHILRLLTDPVGEVRYYALQALVLDLKHELVWYFPDSPVVRSCARRSGLPR